MLESEKSTKNISGKMLGRPRKKDYDAVEQFQRVLNTVVDVYSATGEINATAAELDMSSIKIKKLLITAGKLEYDETKQILRLVAYGKKLSEIQEEMGLGKSSINSYLPYTKAPYKEAEISANAERCNLYRKRKKAIEEINDFESFWLCIGLFEGYPFLTVDGNKYTYECKDERILVSCKDIFFNRLEVEMVYKAVCGSKCEDAFCGLRRKDESVCGMYLYPIFRRYGIVK